MKMDKTKVVGLMKNQGIDSLSELADQIGVSQSTMSHWFSGSWKPSFENLENLCRALNCTVDDFLVYDPKDQALAVM